MAEIRLMVSCHQMEEVPPLPLLRPIQVGAALSSEPFPGFLQDDTGENISHKNRSYCELTAQYWAWKNLTADHYGFFHYRRYLYPDRRAKRPYRIERAAAPEVLERLGYGDFPELIPQYDLILPRGEDMHIPVWEHYAKAPHHHEKDLKLAVELLLDAHPEYVAITNRAAKEGDIVDIDYVGMKDGVAFEGGTSEGYKLELGSGSFIDGFEEGLVGAKIGEKRSLDLTFPEQYHSEELAGQAVVFDVTVNGIEEKRDAVLDDNFVQRMSDFTTVDEFKADTRADIETEKGQIADQQLETDIFLAAVENSQFELNEDAVNQQYENQMSYLTSMIQMYGMTMEDYAQMSDMTPEEMETVLKKKEPDRGTFNGIGIPNVNERIHLLFGADYGLHYESRLKEYTKAIYRLPVVTGGGET